MDVNHVIEDYGSPRKSGISFSDNADSNDMLMDTLQKLLHDRHDITYDVTASSPSLFWPHYQLGSARVHVSKSRSRRSPGEKQGEKGR